MPKSNGINAVFKLSTTLIGALLTIITTLSLFITTGLKTDINNVSVTAKEIDTKLFNHLTNHDLHRTDLVSTAEFKSYIILNEATQGKMTTCILEVKELVVKNNEITQKLYENEVSRK